MIRIRGVRTIHPNGWKKVLGAFIVFGVGIPITLASRKFVNDHNRPDRYRRSTFDPSDPDVFLNGKPVGHYIDIWKDKKVVEFNGWKNQTTNECSAWKDQKVLEFKEWLQYE